ncbi:MAG: PilZ domain-containing protein [Bdellovibrionales bacterium]
MEKRARASNRRKSIRFEPDLGCFVFLEVEPKGTLFCPKISGLTIDESFRGCSFVALADPTLVKDVTVKIKTGHLKAMLGEVRWVKKLSPKIMHVGIEYLE